RNNSSVANTVPEAPTGLSSTVGGTTVTFSWDPATDGETPSAGLNYNWRLGTAPGLSDIVGPMADADAGSTQPGYRRVPARGNADGVTSRSIGGLTLGQTYYWSVQSIDTAFAGSPF